MASFRHHAGFTIPTVGLNSFIHTSVDTESLLPPLRYAIVSLTSKPQAMQLFYFLYLFFIVCPKICITPWLQGLLPAKQRAWYLPPKETPSLSGKYNFHRLMVHIWKKEFLDIVRAFPVCYGSTFIWVCGHPICRHHMAPHTSLVAGKSNTCSTWSTDSRSAGVSGPSLVPANAVQQMLRRSLHHPCTIWSPNILSIILWNVLGALQRPKTIRLNSNTKGCFGFVCLCNKHLIVPAG